MKARALRLEKGTIDERRIQERLERRGRRDHPPAGGEGERTQFINPLKAING